MGDGPDEPRWAARRQTLRPVASKTRANLRDPKCHSAPISLRRSAMDQGANSVSPFLLRRAGHSHSPCLRGRGNPRKRRVQRTGWPARALPPPCPLAQRKRREAKAGRPWLAAPPCLRAPCGSAMRRQSGIKIRSGFKGWKCRSAQVPPRPYAMETEAK